MAKDDLKILITAGLNYGLSLKEINTAISGIEKKIKKLKLKVEIPQDFQKSIQGFITATEKMKRISDEQNKVMEQHERIIKKADGSTEKLTEQILKNGEIIKKSRTITDEKTKSTEKYTDAIEKQKDELEELGRLEKERIRRNSQGEVLNSSQTRKNDNVTTTANFNSDGKLTNTIEVIDYAKDIKEIEAIDKAHFMALKSDRAKKETLDKLHYLALQKNRERDQQLLEKKYKEAEALDRAHFMALKDNKKRIEDMDKLHYLALQRNREFDLKKQDEYHKLEMFKQKSLIDVQNLIRRFDGTVDNKALDDYVNKVNKLTTDTPELRKEMDKLNLSFKEIGANAQTSGSHAITMGQALKTAFQKFPIWMLAATAFYAPIRFLEASVQTLVQIDKQTTELRRVLDPSFDFNGMLKDSIQLANELGKSIQDINEAMIGFARQGDFSQEQIKALTRTAILAANISDLTVEESMSAMVSAMEIFNITAEDSISIINRMNEVDNSFAITTKDLAIALQKSGSAGEAFGVTIDEMIGHITAIGVQTRESGAIVGNSLKTIYSRLTTMQPSIDALASIGINVKDANGEMKTATQVISELQSKWNGLNAETQQSLAVTLAGRFQLSRFIALMEGQKLSVDATTTSLNSYGSAVRENAEYQKSLEARINKMKNAFTELMLAIGDAVLTDSLIILTKSLGDLARFGASISNTFGVLPPLFGTIGVIVLAASSNFRTFAISLVFADTMAKRLTISTAALKVGLRSLMLASVVGAAFAALGFIIEKLVNQFSDSIQSAEGMNSVLSDSQKEVFKLSERYKDLKEIIESNTRSDKEITEAKTELSSIIQAISGQMPNLISQWDEHGRVIDINISKLDAWKKEYASVLSFTEKENLVNLRNREKELKENIEREKRIFNNLQGSDLSLFDSLIGKDVGDYKSESARKIKEYADELAKTINKIKTSEETLAILNGTNGKSSTQFDDNLDPNTDLPERKRGRFKSPEEIEEEYNARKEAFEDKMKKFNHLINIEASGYKTAKEQLQKLQAIRAEFGDLREEDLYGIDEDIFRTSNGKIKPTKPKKSGKSPAELAKEQREKAFKENMAHFRFLVEIQNWSADEQIAGLERIAKKHKDYLSESVDDERAIKAEIKRIQDDQAKNAIDNIKKQQKKAEEAHKKVVDMLNIQLSISKERMGLLSEDSADYRKELEKQVDILSQKLRLTEQDAQLAIQAFRNSDMSMESYEQLKVRLKEVELAQYEYLKAIEDTKKAMRGLISNVLEEQMEKHLDIIEKGQKERIKQLEQQLEDSNKFYEDQIELQEDKLKLLDDEIEKEDRLLKLRELNDEINKVKNDKRFSYITADGEEILTYDKGKVSELEKQREELLRQYEREDIKQAIQDEIDRLREAKEQKEEILRQEIDALNEQYQQELEATKLHWENLIKGIENGTIGYDELLHGENGFYSRAVSELQRFGVNVQSQINMISDLFNSLSSIRVSIPSLPQAPSYEEEVRRQMAENSAAWHGASAEEKKRLHEENLRLGTQIGGVYDPGTGKWNFPTKHKGGTVEGKPPSRITQLMDKLFNLAPNEQMVKALKGELFVPEQNIGRNFIPNMRNLATSMSGIGGNQQQPVVQKIYNFNDTVIKSDNPNDFLNQIDYLITSQQK
jgi:TP901 family phage tail tape measure protein